MNNINYFNSLIRINDMQETTNKDSSHLLLPDNIGITYYSKEELVQTTGLGKLDKKKDLIEVVNIIDAFNCKYENTNIFSPRPYLESLSPILNHTTVQGIILTKPKRDYKEKIHKLDSSYNYGKTSYDKFWVSDKPIESILETDTLMILNRRVGGWDGSVDRPVIELLGAGGHIASVYKSENFISHTPEETIRKEVAEELGLESKDYTINKLGGFFNSITSELVIIFGIWVPFEHIEEIQRNAFGNLEENIDGIYLGIFDDIIKQYLNDANPFAGGEKAKNTNFPSNKRLMKKIRNEIRQIK